VGGEHEMKVAVRFSYTVCSMDLNVSLVHSMYPYKRTMTR
jgi:hypothetical protein